MPSVQPGSGAAAVRVRWQRNAVWPRTTPVLFDQIVLEEFMTVSAQYLLEAAGEGADALLPADAVAPQGAWRPPAPQVTEQVHRANPGDTRD